jgi:hypothetical protein
VRSFRTMPSSSPIIVIRGHPLDKMTAPPGRVERVSEVQSLVDDFVALELHDAHGVNGFTVVLNDVLSDPEIITASDALDLELELRRVRLLARQ